MSLKVLRHPLAALLVVGFWWIARYIVVTHVLCVRINMLKYNGLSVDTQNVHWCPNKILTP